jgi:hypothetical protein
MATQTIEDRLRAEYFSLLPELVRVRERLEAEIRYHLLPITQELVRYERILISARVKGCISAIDRLRRDMEFRTFAEEVPEKYSLLDLHDLAGVRVSVFPQSRLDKVHDLLTAHFREWIPDPFPYEATGDFRAYKYHGHSEASKVVVAEFQVVPIVIGLFWEVEHDALYKPLPELKGIGDDLEMRDRSAQVLRALRAFEDEFEKLVTRGNAAGPKLSN